MTLDEFLKRLDLYGSDFAKWPAEIRDEAAKSLQDSADFKRTYENYQKFEALLRTFPIQAASNGLDQRIIHRLGQTQARSWKISWSFNPAPILGFTVIFLLGFLLGFVVYQRTLPKQSSTAISFNDFLYEYEETSR